MLLLDDPEKRLGNPGFEVYPNDWIASTIFLQKFVNNSILIKLDFSKQTAPEIKNPLKLL